MEKVTVREIIEMLAKGDWDSEVTVITEAQSKDKGWLHSQYIGRKITAISRSTQNGTQIVIQDED